MGLTTEEDIEKRGKLKEIIREKAPIIKVSKKVQRQKEVKIKGPE